MARPNPLAKPEFAKAVGEAFAAGLSRQEMADLFGVKDLDTITRWRRDPRAKAVALKVIEDRVLQVTRKVDGVIAERLEHASELSIDELLKIRKEFLGGALRAQTEKADEETIAEAQDWLDNNPEQAAALEEMFSNPSKVPGGVAQDTRKLGGVVPSTNSKPGEPLAECCDSLNPCPLHTPKAETAKV